MAWQPLENFSRQGSVMRTLSSGWPARTTKRSRLLRNWGPEPIRFTRSLSMFKHLESKPHHLISITRLKMLEFTG
uniref:Uncharacterized protein n=1 Tax=Anguilla anguilla TaxID=7936 RepID=A0A0E9U850_ANGAN